MAQFFFVSFLFLFCRSAIAFSPLIFVKPANHQAPCAVKRTIVDGPRIWTSTHNSHRKIKLKSHSKEESDTSLTLTESEPQKEEEYHFDSLDVMLNKARNRKMVLLPYKIQIIANKPIINLLGMSSLNLGECLLILAAIRLGSIGFCIGYLGGKLTTRFLGKLNAPIALVQLWTVLLAVFSDVVWNNIFWLISVVHFDNLTSELCASIQSVNPFHTFFCKSTSAPRRKQIFAKVIH